jgi:hypothetical protein
MPSTGSIPKVSLECPFSPTLSVLETEIVYGFNCVENVPGALEFELLLTDALSELRMLFEVQLFESCTADEAWKDLNAAIVDYQDIKLRDAVCRLLFVARRLQNMV